MTNTSARHAAIVLLSGGLDSATTLAIARAGGFSGHALTFDYGQRHRVEIEAARNVARSLGAAEHVLMRIDLRGFGGSSLTDDRMDVPKDRPLPAERGSPRGAHGLQSVGVGECGALSVSSSRVPSGSVPREDIPITYVPARNTIFLSFALALAEVREARDIFIGVNAVDYSGYPDCRPQFIRAFEAMANLATRAAVEGRQLTIHAPLIDLTKAQIIRRGTELGVDYSLTRSCYDPDPTTGRPCRRCDSCLLRAAGFREAGVRDPLVLE